MLRVLLHLCYRQISWKYVLLQRSSIKLSLYTLIELLKFLCLQFEGGKLDMSASMYIFINHCCRYKIFLII